MNDISLLPREEAKAQFDYWTEKLQLKHTFSFDEVYDMMLERRKKEEFRSKIMAFEEHVKSMPGSLGEDPFPLVHTFGDGVYVRQLTVPPETLTVTKIHGKTHPFFLLKGTISILTENGIKKLTAPYSGITKAGTKRIIWHHDEVVFTTVHVTNETDLDKIEDELIVKNFNELNEEDNIKSIDDFMKLLSKEGE